MINEYFEAVELCFHCGNENIYPMYNVGSNGYVVICKHCGKKIMLCDECLHAEDNPSMKCDWVKTKYGGKCFRGITKI
jgi:hypothetical protein